MESFVFAQEFLVFPGEPATLFDQLSHALDQFVGTVVSDIVHHKTSGLAWPFSSCAQRQAV